MVDTSGSNAGGQGQVATDPGKVLRAGSIEQFYADYGSKANFNWGFVHFQFQSAWSLISSGFGAGSIMPGAITQFKAVRRLIPLAYKAAITLSKSIINGDNSADLTLNI